MFSAFSFGKIIKTILPGAILTAGLLVLLEGLWQLWHPGKGFLLAAVSKDWITAFTAALIPVSLILGFFLNTFTWMALNPVVRSRSDAMLSATVYADLRKKLSEGLWEESKQLNAGAGRAFGPVTFPNRPTLEFYYLPVVTLTNLNYLWESYFCWYEFDINSACALVLSAPASGFLLWVRLHGQCQGLLFLLIIVLLGLFCTLCGLLWHAAVKNLVSYEKNLLLLINGSLVNAAKNPKPAPIPGAEQAPA